MINKSQIEEYLSSYTDEELNYFVYDSVCDGLCLSCGMEHFSCEPDARENYCEECGEQTVKSVLEILFDSEL